MRGILFASMVWAGTAVADPVDQVFAAATESFDRMPALRMVDEIAGNCGADTSVNAEVAFCTTANRVFLTTTARQQPYAPYLVAHVLGHAVQVQHGMADVALREIRQRRSEERQLRTYVESQVNCIAGVLYQRAGLPTASLTDWFDNEPLTDPHWGRNPLRQGPTVSITLDTANAWFQQGQRAGDPAVCAVGEFGADLLIAADKG
ncbi:MAG: neutral zinc metallopeptidase [Pseudomonadota bacterium]